MKVTTKFRAFCTEMWYKHREEILEWERRLPQYDSTYYFRKHRWFLKNAYKAQSQINNIGETVNNG